MSIPLDLVGSILSFTGGVVLTLNAFRVRYDLRVEQGALLLLDELKKNNTGHILTDEEGMPLDNEERLRRWLSKGSLRRAQVGFVLMTVGFLLDLFSRLDRP